MTTAGFTPSAKAASLPVLFLGFMGALQMGDPIVSALALPRAAEALDFDPTVYALAASISTLALAATVVPSGVIADKIGRRKMLVLALLLTTVGDLIAAMAPGSVVFLIGRALAGVGLGAVFAGSFGFVRSVVTPRTLPAALGIFAAMCSVPLFVFMPLSSALAGYNWRAGYLMIPFFCLLAAFGCVKILPKLEPVATEEKKEYWGLVALGVGIVGLLMGITNGAKSLTSSATILPIVIGLVFLGAFALIEAKAKNPSYPIELFKSPLFLAGALGGFAWNAASAVGQLMSSNLWQYAEGFTPLQASVRQLPVMVFSIISAVLAGRALAKGTSSILVLVTGGVLTAVGLAGAGLLSTQATGVLFIAMLCVAFFGCGVMTVPQSQMFVLEAPAAYYGPVTSSRTCVGQLGYAIGYAGGAAIASAFTAARLVSDGLSRGAADAELTKFIGGDSSVSDQVATFYTDGVATSLYAFAAIVGLCTLIILALGRKASERAQHHADVAAASA